MELKELATQLKVTEKAAKGLIDKYGLDLDSISDQNITELKDELNSKALVSVSGGRVNRKISKVSHPISTEIELELEQLKAIAQIGFDSPIGDVMAKVFLKGAEIKTKKAISSGVSQIVSSLNQIELKVDLDLNLWEDLDDQEVDLDYNPWQ